MRLRTCSWLVLLTGLCLAGCSPGGSSTAENSTPPPPPASGANGPSEGTPAAESAPAADPDSMVGKLQANPELSTFVELSQMVGMMKVYETLKGATVLAPNNAAFAALPEGKLDKLKSDKKQLRNLLAGHVTMGTMRTKSIKEEKDLGVLSQSGDRMPVQASGDEVTVGGAKLVESDIEANGAVLHVIDKVLDVKYDPEKTAGPFGVNLWVLKEDQ